MSNPEQAVSPHLWFVTVTVAGDVVDAQSIRSGLERLSHEHPFLLSGRYASDRAEVRYWEEGPNAQSVLDLAVGLWAEHRESAGLPDWEVVGVEVIDRETFHRRGRHLGHGPGLIAAGGVSPL
ncbi:MAG: hypothetical protein ACO3ID_11580 [Candidatus Nanopelagicales bacterium]|jgi:hypothetical protein